jgi:hypothetical protein
MLCWLSMRSLRSLLLLAGSGTSLKVSSQRSNPFVHVIHVKRKANFAAHILTKTVVFHVRDYISEGSSTFKSLTLFLRSRMSLIF